MLCGQYLASLEKHFDEGELSREASAEEFSVVRKADDHARNEYEHFDFQRRDCIEGQAEAYIKDLEHAAKQLPAHGKKGKLE